MKKERTQNGKRTLLNEAQVTVIVEAMKKPVSSGTKVNLASQMQGIDTTKSRALRIDLLHRQIEAEMQGNRYFVMGFVMAAIGVSFPFRVSWKELANFFTSRPV